METNMALAVRRLKSRIAAVTFFTFGSLAVGHAEELTAIRAREAWERAIEAKGGRDRLYGISNAVFSATSNWKLKGVGQITVSYETLLVLPSKLWEWSDERPSKLGLRLRVVDLSRDYAQVVYPDVAGADPQPPPGKPNIGDIRKITVLQAVTFLETRWLKPRILRAKPARWRLKAVDGLYSQIGEQTYVFYLDRHTYIPLRVLVNTPTRYGPHQEEYRLGDYGDVSGLQLPHSVYHKHLSTPDSGSWERIQYQLNIDYDEDVFRRTPSLDHGPTGWRHRN